MAAEEKRRLSIELRQVITVTVEYTCTCMLARWEPVQVRARREREDLDEWMDIIRDAVSELHERQSPMCPSPVCSLRFHLPKDARYLGEAMRQ